MYGLEASNDNSCPSSQSRATARPRRAVDAATRLVAPDCLIAPGAGCPIPSLSGVSTEYRFVDGLDTVAALGKSLLTVGLAQVNAWTETKGDALRFVERTIQDELDQHGATEIEREFFFNFSVVSDLEAYGPERGEPDGELYLILEPDSAGYVVLGPTLRALERIHPSLPATFFGYFADALNRWIRVYDYRDAAERVEQLREWYAADPDAESVELPDVDGATPKSVRGRRRLLGEKTVERLAGTVRNRKLRALLEGVLELRATSAKGSRPKISEQASEQLMDSNSPVPALVAVFEKHDAIEGCFDEEAQGMLECPPEPNLIVPFRAWDEQSVQEAFRTLRLVCDVLCRASRLIGLMSTDRE